ncbi:MAG: hydrogenase maturation protease [Sedimentisphaerales bacterium]|nr:hydrogenase maturation protease [Sedimentisphaerales bacterium]
MENPKKILVAGLGNPLMADEGIGVLLVQKLALLSQNQDISGYDDVEFYDGGVGGLSLLYKIENRRKVILIDCARMGTSAGTIRRFKPDEVRTIKTLEHFSLHEMDILKVLELAGQLGNAPAEVIIFGIEPKIIAFDSNLSDIIQKNVPRYLDDILNEIKTEQK